MRNQTTWHNYFKFGQEGKYPLTLYTSDSCPVILKEFLVLKNDEESTL